MPTWVGAAAQLGGRSALATRGTQLAKLHQIMWRAASCGLFCLVVPSACGGNVEGGPRDPAPTESPSTTTGGSSAGVVEPDADTELGECKLGPIENYDVDCAWVADKRCYTARDMACNCACPRSGNSQCASGFEAGPRGHVWVACD